LSVQAAAQACVESSRDAAENSMAIGVPPDGVYKGPNAAP